MTTTQAPGETAFATPNDTDFTMTRTFDAPVRLVWAAWTSPEHLPHWMLGPPGWTMPVCEVDLRPGGAWRYEWHHEDGTDMATTGTYREVVPYERLVTTESWGGDWPETLHTLTFVEEGGRTTVTSTQRYPSREARERALAVGMDKGMAASFERLAAHLRTAA
jgi:uncharacterized protein YndB with AHSA1/START domain